ncbi:MAG TPA: hypothetical protein VL691_17510 [Vicinamibacteria bacterium]|nr:hypothetical protein [Vicinamibacteria bacterium]
MTDGRWMFLERFQTVGEAELFTAALRREGIGSELRGRHVPALEPEPAEIWVQPRNAERANAVLLAWRRPADEEEVQCPRCGAPSPLSFERCWSCEQVLPLED